MIQKLGWGHFSTVWLAQKETTREYVALKIQRSKDTHTESAVDELEMLTELRKHEEDAEWVEFLSGFEREYPRHVNARLCRPLLLLDNFAHFGIHGKHMCSVFELMGPNLLDVIQHYEYKEKRMPLWLVKKITRDVLLGLVYLHERCKIIHTDLKPENIMIKLEHSEEQELIHQLLSYKLKPISMKYLRNLQASKNPKSRKKQEKKKLKKKKQQQAEGRDKEDSKEPKEEEEEDEESQPAQEDSSPPNLTPTSSYSQSPLQGEEQGWAAKEFPADEYSDIQDGVDMSILNWKSVRIKLNDKLFFKIADLGNACFAYKHFTEDIQTREYRSPEVLIGHEYFSNTDLFSLACTVYELLTNSFLFKPKKIPGIKKDEDHLFQMVQTLGPIDKDFACSGKYSAELFNKKGRLLNGSPKSVEPISKQLIENFGYQTEAAIAAEQFLLPMLAYDPRTRIDARTCLQSKWLWT